MIKWLWRWLWPTTVDSITNKLATTLQQLDDHAEQCGTEANELAALLVEAQREGDRASRIADKLRDILD